MKPSISIWIDPSTQAVKVDFTPQMLQPAEYGVVLSAFVVHLAREFSRDNPNATEDVILAEILRGLKAGLDQRADMVLPQQHTH